jgi:hypothetical protein
MSREYTNQELERMVLGKVEEPNTVFYEQSKMDPDLSRAAGKRVYRTVLMVKYTQPGVTDWAPQRAQKADIEAHPEEYQRFLATKDDVGSPAIDIIPGVNQDELQELRDYGLVTVTMLCQAKTLPAHLLHVQASARRINEVLKHERESNEKESIEEKVQQTETLPTPGGPVDTGDVGRRVIARGSEESAGETSEGSHQGGRVDHRQGVGSAIPGCNWTLTMG